MLTFCRSWLTSGIILWSWSWSVSGLGFSTSRTLKAERLSPRANVLPLHKKVSLLYSLLKISSDHDEVLDVLSRSAKIQETGNAFFSLKVNNNDAEGTKKPTIVPHNHQIISKDKITKHFEAGLGLANPTPNPKRCIQSKPCGAGKTLISHLVAKSYKQVVIISPLKQFARQNLDKFIE